MNPKDKGQVFLSYAHENLEMIRKVYDGLIKRKVNVWFDKVALGAGKWYPQIMKAIPRSRYFVICMSEAALKKTGVEKPGFQDDELNRAYEIAMAQPDSTFTIVPVRLENCDRGDLRINTFQQYDLFEEFESGLDRLAVNLEGISLADKYAKDDRTEDDKVLESFLGKAETLYCASEFGKALDIYNAVLVLNPENIIGLVCKSLTLNNLERYDDALDASQKAIDIMPDYAGAWLSKGVSLKNLHRLDEALEACQKATNSNPDNSTAWFYKGACLGERCKNEEALEAYQKAIDIKPDLKEALFNKSFTLGELGRYEEAVEAYQKYIDIYPGLADPWFNKGLALKKLHRHKDADKCFAEAKALGGALNNKIKTKWWGTTFITIMILSSVFSLFISTEMFKEWRLFALAVLFGVSLVVGYRMENRPKL